MSVYKRLAIAGIVMMVALLPTASSAEDGARDDNVLVRIGADVMVGPTETIGSLVVVDGNVAIQGMVRDNVLVIDGDVVITGAVPANVTVVSGRLELRDGALVKNVYTIDSELVQAPGATITGEINEPDFVMFVSGAVGALSFFFWLVMSIAVVLAGLIFAAIGGRQLSRAAEAITGRVPETVIGTLVVWLGVPLVAALAMMTIVGLAFGIGLLVFFLPALWFLGYIVGAAALGRLFTGTLGRDSREHPYIETTLGLVALQLAVLVPFVGAMVAFLAGLVGAGALAYVAYSAAGGRGLSTNHAAPDARVSPTPTA